MKLIKIFQKVKARFAFREGGPELQHTRTERSETKNSLAPLDVLTGAGGDRVLQALGNLDIRDIEKVRKYDF